MMFSFGKNWQSYLAGIDETALRRARDSISQFLHIENLRGKTFLDIGCGSGIFSFAAHQLGAQRIVSFDVDPASVQCCERMKMRAGAQSNWEIYEKSIFSEDVKNLGLFDVVYSWGVLHHTGDMWSAISKAAMLVAPDGYFYIALYNNVPGKFGSRLWSHIKRWYNASPKPIRLMMEWIYMGKFIVHYLIRLKNPWRKMRQHAVRRGMNWRVDVVDWLGGYPYEYASVGEVVAYLREHFPEFYLVNLKSTCDVGNNSFLFKSYVRK